MKKLGLGILLTIASSITYAQSPSYDFVQASLVHAEFADLAPFELGGFELRGSYEFTDNIFAEASIVNTEDNIQSYSLDMDNWQAEVGYIFNYSRNTKFDLKAGFGDIEFNYQEAEQRFSDSTNFYSLASNIRHGITQNIELKAGLEIQYWRKGSNQKAYNVGAEYHFTQVSIGAEYTKYSDSEFFSFTGRYYF